MTGDETVEKWQIRRQQKESELQGKKYNRVMINLEEALQLLSTHINKKQNKQAQAITQKPLWEAGGAILAVDIRAHEPVPPFNRSPLDGYAIKTADTKKATEQEPVHLTVMEEVAAGYVSQHPVENGKAIKVLTGAPIPIGADAVIRSEEVVTRPDGKISIMRSVAAGEGIALTGEDISLGEQVLKKGELIGPAELGLLASLGVDPVPVFSPPKVGIFSTGDELAPVDQQLQPGKIRVSNIYVLAAIVRAAGGEPVNLGVVPDNLDKVKKMGEMAVEQNLDLIISTGGVSTGDYDVVKDAMAAAGFANLFWKVAIRPGAPVAAAIKEDVIWIGLSGNPAGAIVVAQLVVAPLIAQLARRPFQITKRKAILQTQVSRPKGLRGFWWGHLTEDVNECEVKLLPQQHCGVIKTYHASNCLVEIPAGKVEWLPGELVEVIKLF